MGALMLMLGLAMACPEEPTEALASKTGIQADVLPDECLGPSREILIANKNKERERE